MEQKPAAFGVPLAAHGEVAVGPQLPGGIGRRRGLLFRRARQGREAEKATQDEGGSGL